MKPPQDFAYWRDDMTQPFPKFPVDEAIPQLKTALENPRRAVLSAPPGAGKTTRVPPAMLDAPWINGQRILMLEPRRLAARRAAEYMAKQMGERPGGMVGYRIRGDSVVGKTTRIEVVTEGILTRMLHSAPELPGVGLVIFDEFHERSIHADLGLAFTLDVQNHLRDDLRVLVMSATLDGVAVAKLLGNAPVIESAGNMYPVETQYARFTAEKPLEARVVDTVQRAMHAGNGDVLVFLPGMREIRRVEETLLRRQQEDVVVHVLHGELPARTQDSALAPAPSGMRKIILSTSIAETSLTIDGVRIVVDAGLARTARFDPRRGMSGLVTIAVSRAVADQRRGRAGRQGPGLCFRLWTEAEHEQLPAYPVPEIRVSDLTHVALDLALWGSPSGSGLAFLDPPPEPLLRQAQGVLRDLGATTEQGQLTQHGRAIAELPIHPRLGHMIIKGNELGFGSAACELAALLEERDLLLGGVKNDVDLASRVDALRKGGGARSGASDRIAAQRKRLMEMVNSRNKRSAGEPWGILTALAYPERIARKRSDKPRAYQLSGGTTAVLPPGSLLGREECLAVADLDASSRDAKIYLAAPVTLKELETIFADRITMEENVLWDANEKRVVSRRLRKLGAVILGENPREPQGDEVLRAFVDGIRRTGLQSLPWEKEVERFRARAGWARRSVKETADVPDLSDEALLGSLETWLAPWLEGMWKLDQLQRLRLMDVLRGMFSPQQLRELDRLAPSHLIVPSGSKIAIDYTRTDHPVLSVKLQELFGLTETPRVGGGAVPVTIYLLSPAARPLAVTQDLRSFWLNVYPEIRKQLRARYPKHPWPENPLTATPTKRTLRRK